MIFSRAVVDLKTYTQDVLKKDFYLDGKFVCEYTADLDKHLE